LIKELRKKETEKYCPKSRSEWRQWLEKNHQSEKSVWLVYYRANTKVDSLSWSDAVDEALCFGWIDSTKKTIDEEKYMQYFSNRKPKSSWSKINKDKVAKLIENNLMTKAGFESIDIAKQNGSWSFLDDVEALVIPKDLQEELGNHKGSRQFFDSLSKSNKKILLHWVISAKRVETRQKRVLEIAVSARDHLKPKQFR
jgi:uncharacterized protein YdeI (YjbR/CyaY-like superfamily)